MEIVFFIAALCVWGIYVGIQWTGQAFNRELEDSTNIEFIHYFSSVTSNKNVELKFVSYGAGVHDGI